MSQLKITGALLGVGLLLGATKLAVGAGGVVSDTVVLRVVVVETSDVDAYVKEIDRGKAILKSAGSPAKIRVWRARFAGPQAGAVVVSAEFPSLAAFAEDDARLSANAEYQTWLKGLDKIRKIVSDSLYSEVGS